MLFSFDKRLRPAVRAWREPEWCRIAEAPFREFLERSGTMRAIAEHELPAIHALLLDFWPFIDFFPRQVRATFRGAPLAELRRRGLRGLAQIASLAVRYYPHLHTDDFAHDELWLRMG